MIFPKRLHGKTKLVAVRLPGKPMGGMAKIHLRNIAKNIPEYHQKIETGICGQDGLGNKIPINSVGRWLFGVPGYMGHIRVMHWEGDCKIDFPADSPEIVHRLVQLIKEKAEA